MSRIIGAREGVNDLTSRKHDYVTADMVTTLVVDVVRQALNMAIAKLDERNTQREKFLVACIMDELVAKGVLPPLDQSEEVVTELVKH